MAGDSKNGRQLDKLLEGSSPQAPTYVLATILSDFTARKGTTELSVRQGDDVYIMFALEGWAFAAHMKSGGHRGYVPLGYCEAVQDFYASPALEDTQNKRGVQQKKQPAAIHSTGHSTRGEASSTDLTAQPCEIYPPPKEFESSTPGEPEVCHSPKQLVPTSHGLRDVEPAAAPDETRLAAAVCRSCTDHERPLLDSIVSATSRPPGHKGSMTTCSSELSIAALPTPLTGTVREAGCPRSQHRCCGCSDKQPDSPVPLLTLTVPPPSARLSQDESGIGESNGSTGSSSDWCWEALLPPATAATVTAADKRSHALASYATGGSCGSSRTSCSDSLEELAAAPEICPCCLCPWPCANTTLSSCECLCQGPPPHYRGHERPVVPPTGRRHQRAPNAPHARGFTDEHGCYEDQRGGNGSRGSSTRAQPTDLSSGSSSSGGSALDDALLSPSSQGLLLLRSRAKQATVQAAEASYGCDDDVFAQAWQPAAASKLQSLRQGSYPTRSVTFDLRALAEPSYPAQLWTQQWSHPSLAKPYSDRPWNELHR